MEFLRKFEVHSLNVIWFLNAGCSVSGGILSAGDIVWDRKSHIYCSEYDI